MVKLKLHTYYIIPYNRENITKYKSSDNILKHARYNKNTFGWFFIDREFDDLIGYIGCEGDTVIALEVTSDYKGRGYASRLLNLAKARGVVKLSVDKNNTHAIEVYKHLGYKKYDSDNRMIYMKIDNKK